MEAKTGNTLLSTLTHIPWSEIKLDRLLGEGGYGAVHHGHWQGIEVAIKQLHLKKLGVSLLDDFKQEATLMAKCRFPYVAELYGVCIEENRYAMVMAYVPKGSLYDVLHDTSELLPWNPVRWEIGIEIGKGLAYLHRQQIVHRDMKSFNVLLDNWYHAKITDFGMAKLKLQSSSTGTQNKKGMGTTRWLAPELFKRGASPNFASDVYGYGMVLWEIASRQLPYQDAQNDTVAMGWIKDGEKENVPTECPVEYGQIIQKAWGLPEHRPTASEIGLYLEKVKPNPELKPEKSYKEKSWHFDVETKQITQLEGKEYALIPASARDIQKVIGFYAHHPVPGYGVSQVEVIYNPSFNRAFELHLRKLQQRENNSAFIPKWSSMSHTDLRQTTYNLFTQLTQPYVDHDYPSIKLLPAWHGTKPQVLDSLFSAGYANLSTTDVGYFGKGYYSAYEAAYSYRVYSKGALILNWVASFSPLPVIDGDMDKLEGKGNYGNYDAHFVPVVPRNPANPNETIYFPCKANQPHQYTEMVVFDSAALLPRYLVELQPEGLGLKSPIMPIVTPPKLFTPQPKTNNTLQKPSKKDNIKTFSQLQVPGESIYFEGVLAIQHTQYKKAHACYEQAAVKQYPAAYLWLGNLNHYGGLIGPKNMAISEKWYDKVRREIDWFKAQAHMGRADAQRNLGLCYYDGQGVAKDLTQAVHYYRLAAEQGHAIAQNNLGLCYKNGQGVAKDLTQAVHYYQLAAEQGYASAQNNLGLCYKNGQGVAKDLTQAVHYFQLAAEQGYASAQFNLGICYENGQGVAKDLTQTVHYIRLAAEQGHANAQNNLALCYKNGKGVAKDLTQAVHYFQLAAEQGYASAQFNLGNYYTNELGVAKDLTQAVHYFRLAAEQGLAGAQNNLGLCYENGLGVAKDLTQAVHYFQLAAEQGLANAQNNLGNCYKNGQGVAKDLTQAVHYFQLAAEQGYEDAKAYLLKHKKNKK